MIAHNNTNIIHEAAGSKAYIDITSNRCNGSVRAESLIPYHYIVHNKVMPHLPFLGLEAEAVRRVDCSSCTCSGHDWFTSAVC